MAGTGNGRGGPQLALVGKDPLTSFYVREAARRGGPVLVLGVGDGRLVWELGRAGLGVVAVDPSARLVESAEELRVGQPSELAARVRLLESDLRVLRLPERFSVALAPQNALGLMGSRDDLEAFLATAAHHLRPEGGLLFDVPNAPPRALPEATPHWHPQGGVEPPRPVFSPHLRERHRGKGGEGIRRLRLRHFSPDEIDQALAATGFLLTERYGDAGQSPFEPKAPLQVVVAHREGGGG